MQISGFFIQMLNGAWVTLQLASCAALLGISVGIIGAFIESIKSPWLRYPAASFIFIIRGLPELLILFFIYFGMTIIISNLTQTYIEISAFAAGVCALGLIFGAYAAPVFRGAFLAIEPGQLEAGRAMGFTRLQLITHIQLPQAWRHALPGLGNLWLVLLKDTSIVMLIGLMDLMSQAKLAAATTQQPFTYYFAAAVIYLIITSCSQKILEYFSLKANRHI